MCMGFGRYAAVAAIAGALALCLAPAHAQVGSFPPNPANAAVAAGVGFDQKVNTQIPLNLPFTDSNGAPVTLDQFFHKKPVILVLPFYKCTTGCTREMQGMAEAFNHLNYKLGKDFYALSVSINPDEGPAIAATRKLLYTGAVHAPTAASGWHFLTGPESSIEALTKAVGFRYLADVKTQQFAHPTGIIILTPEGKTYRYIFGTQYATNDLRIALTKASHNAIGSVVDQILSLCCQWDPKTGHYGVIIQRVIEISGTGTVLVLAGSIFLMVLWEKKHMKTPEQALAERAAAKAEEHSDSV